MSFFEPETGDGTAEIPAVPPAPAGGAPSPDRERPGGKVVIAVVAVLVVLLAGGYVAAYAVAGDKVPKGTTISGVEVGGLTRDAAIDKVEKAFAERATETIDVSVEARLPSGSSGNGSALTAADLGLSVDAAASVDKAGAGASWNPTRQWDYFAGGGDVDAVVDVDEKVFEAQLDTLSKGLGTPPKDGQVLFTKDGVQTVPPAAGDAVDRDAAKEALGAAFLEGDDAVKLTVETAQPEIDADDVKAAVDSFATPAMAHPVTLKFGEAEVVLQPAQFASALSMVPEDGALVGVVDPAKVVALVEAATTDGEPVDATVRIVKGKPEVVPSKPGVTFDPAEVGTVFEGLVTQPLASRTGTVTAEVQEADFSTKDAEALGIVEKISSFTTHYPHADYRNINIGRAAKLVNGTILKPGEEFSLNGIVGERTRANGFTEGYIIANGILKKDLGGGVSQMATTTFNAMFFAGLKDVQHKPHSFYIDRYPVGREATVAWPTVDLRFKNDTQYGVLIRSWVEPSSWSKQGSVTVQMFSTKIWDIESKTSGRYAQVPPATRTLTTPDCEPNTGWSGFQVDVTRIFRKHGQSAVDHTEKFHTVYTPADSVVCKKPGPPGGAASGTPADPGD